MNAMTTNSTSGRARPFGRRTKPWKAWWKRLWTIAAGLGCLAAAASDYPIYGAGDYVENNGVGVYYDGALYIFDTESAQLVPSYDICCHLFLNGRYYSGLPSLNGSSYAQVAPLIIEGELWLFHTGENQCLYYKKTTNPTKGWESSWHELPISRTSNNLEIAPVYNPLTHRLAVYYFSNNYIWWVYSDNYGATWSVPRPVTSVELVSGAPSAVYCPQGSSDTLLAIRTYASTNGANSVVVYNVSNGTALPGPTTFPGVIKDGRPFVTSLDESRYIVTWKSAADGSVWMSRMGTGTGVWQPALQVVGQEVTWSPTGAVGYSSSGGLWYGDFYIIWSDKIGPIRSSWTMRLLEYWTIPGP